ncbi:hypothetical protein CFOL_v3_16502 [Cephalotus follicularis]|uniref:Uncharacterized protein n=1 Tax=Cephalotus follicularis TaxID=3775 RepID=A0A1Q3BYB8_CEPFO|nr:hypothetical protein CFOL_v3_16502 [Cephalotus follicularis]
MVIIAFCLEASTQIAILSAQSSESHFHPVFHMFFFAITVVFSSLAVSKLICAMHPVAAKLLEKIAIFFVATAFFLAITNAIPLWLKCICWTIYSISFLAILICNRY